MAATASRAPKAAAKKPGRARASAASDKPHSAESSTQVRAGTMIYTVGHSTRPLEDFIALLAAHGVQRLVDVRTVPRSRHNPQFNRDTLPAALKDSGIEYSHVAALGGLRKPKPDSPNAGWRNLSFRGYADHMQTAEFGRSLDELMALAKTEQLALMCAEAVPWRCHRSLIGDALLVHGIGVEEIVDAKRRQPHRLTPFAAVHETTITYPPEAAAASQPDLFSVSPGNARGNSAE
jgi:hypothetical protein